MHCARSRLSTAGKTESSRARSDDMPIEIGMSIVAGSIGGAGEVVGADGVGTSKCPEQLTVVIAPSSAPLATIVR